MAQIRMRSPDLPPTRTVRQKSLSYLQPEAIIIPAIRRFTASKMDGYNGRRDFYPSYIGPSRGGCSAIGPRQDPDLRVDWGLQLGGQEAWEAYDGHDGKYSEVREWVAAAVAFSLPGD